MRGLLSYAAGSLSSSGVNAHYVGSDYASIDAIAIWLRVDGHINSSQQIGDSESICKINKCWYKNNCTIVLYYYETLIFVVLEMKYNIKNKTSYHQFSFPILMVLHDRQPGVRDCCKRAGRLEKSRLKEGKLRKGKIYLSKKNNYFIKLYYGSSEYAMNHIIYHC